ncbi:hypothetical protein GCM10017744_102370 [Streptomyces antimycoticus]|uniref:Uncharacterized protein n=1 Tax=Streptomyces antimycoticus TaxID=68175 RepID=A0A4D4KRR4_9ACTN|nr:hypothetical protein SANT12839_101520 [Streptomyces antimycoticus]
MWSPEVGPQPEPDAIWRAPGQPGPYLPQPGHVLVVPGAQALGPDLERTPGRSRPGHPTSQIKEKHNGF